MNCAFAAITMTKNLNSLSPCQGKETVAQESDYGPNIERGLSLVALHRFPKFKEDCKDILNHQWPRSETLRYRSLNASCDTLPTSLVLVDYQDSGDVQVLGHARINRLPNDEESVWIESVIIHHEKRGKGYGRILMTKTENFASNLGFKIAVLSTHGEEEFYKKLGYTFCSPVSLYGGVVSKLFLPKFFVSSVLNNNNSINKNFHGEKPKNLQPKSHLSNLKEISLSPSPPPPPPPPQLFNCKLRKTDIQRIDQNSQKIFMRKPISNALI